MRSNQVRLLTWLVFCSAGAAFLAFTVAGWFSYADRGSAFAQAAVVFSRSLVAALVAMHIGRARESATQRRQVLVRVHAAQALLHLFLAVCGALGYLNYEILFGVQLIAGLLDGNSGSRSLAFRQDVSGDAHAGHTSMLADRARYLAWGIALSAALFLSHYISKTESPLGLGMVYGSLALVSCGIAFGYSRFRFAAEPAGKNRTAGYSLLGSLQAIAAAAPELFRERVNLIRFIHGALTTTFFLVPGFLSKQYLATSDHYLLLRIIGTTCSMFTLTVFLRSNVHLRSWITRERTLLWIFMAETIVNASAAFMPSVYWFGFAYGLSWALWCTVEQGLVMRIQQLEGTLNHGHHFARSEASLSLAGVIGCSLGLLADSISERYTLFSMGITGVVICAVLLSRPHSRSSDA